MSLEIISTKDSSSGKSLLVTSSERLLLTVLFKPKGLMYVRAKFGTLQITITINNLTRIKP